MEAILSLALKLFFIFLLIALIWYGRWVGVFAAIIPICMCQIVVPVPIFTFQGYRSFIYIIPLGLSVFVIRSLLIKKVEEPPFEGAIKNGKIEKNTAMLKGVVALFFFIIVLNYLRTGVDIYMISKGINFIVFNNMVLVPCFLCFFMSMLCKTTKDLKVILLFMAGGGILILFDSIMLCLHPV